MRSHRKLMVIDGATAFTGGMNIGRRHVLSKARRPVVDLHFRIDGPVVADLQKTFIEDWHFAARQKLDAAVLFPLLQEGGGALVREVADGPDREYRKLQWIVTGALSCARRSVHIMTPYLIPDRQLIAALATAALRGVEVCIILPTDNNLPYVHWATRSYLEELIRYGVRVFYQPPPFVHTKLFLVDGVWSMIGSANLDPRSLRLNFEINLEVYDQAFEAELANYFEESLSQSEEVTIGSLLRRPLALKLLDATARLFSPYL